MAISDLGIFKGRRKNPLATPVEIREEGGCESAEGASDGAGSGTAHSEVRASTQTIAPTAVEVVGDKKKTAKVAVNKKAEPMPAPPVPAVASKVNRRRG